MCKQMGIGVDVKEANDVLVPHNPSTASLRERFSWNNLPKVIRIVVCITRDLLAY